MRLLLIASYRDSLIVFRGELIRALLARKVQVHVAAPGLNDSDGVCRTLAEWGVVCHALPLERTGTSVLADLRLLRGLRRLMCAVRPDAVLGYTIKPVVYGTLAAWSCRVSRRFALVTGLGYAFVRDDARGGLRRIVQMLYRHALRRAHKVFFQNPDDERLFRARGLLPARVPAVVVNGSGVDVDAYAQASIPAGPLIFLMIARLLGDKGVREYVMAAALIRSNRPDARFRLAGWIDENPDAIRQEELDRWIADGTIDYLGKLDDVRPAIASSAVYVLPSYREGTPRTVLEAMSMGRAIITTDTPGCRETVIDGENGYLVPIRTVDALANAMKRFIDDQQLAMRMGRQSRRIAEEKYDVHKINAVMLREMGMFDVRRGDEAHEA